MALKGATPKAHFSSARAHHVGRSCACLAWAWTISAKNERKGVADTPQLGWARIRLQRSCVAE
eukprot:1115899-Pyramimonas_sp.AAC.1